MERTEKVRELTSLIKSLLEDELELSNIDKAVELVMMLKTMCKIYYNIGREVR